MQPGERVGEAEVSGSGDAARARRRSTSPLRVAVLAVVVLAVSTAGYLTWRARQPPPMHFCDGIGLLGVPAPSPRGALDAFFLSGGGQRSDPEVWREHDDAGGNAVTFTNADYPHGYRSIDVERGGQPSVSASAEEWIVQGACL